MAVYRLSTEELEALSSMPTSRNRSIRDDLLFVTNWGERPIDRLVVRNQRVINHLGAEIDACLMLILGDEEKYYYVSGDRGEGGLAPETVEHLGGFAMSRETLESHV